MTPATPKPRAGENVQPQFTQADQWRMAEFQRLRTQITDLQAERDLLRERERELVNMLRVAAGELDHAGNALLNCSQPKLADHALKAGAQANALLAKHGR